MNERNKKMAEEKRPFAADLGTKKKQQWRMKRRKEGKEGQEARGGRGDAVSKKIQERKWEGDGEGHVGGEQWMKAASAETGANYEYKK